MGMAALHLCVLALLALCGGALARPTEEGAQANSAAAPDTFPANCAHTPRGNATPEQVQGVWYILEGIYPPGIEGWIKQLGIPTCFLCNFTFENTSLTLSTTKDGREETRTMNLAPNGMWAVQGVNGMVFLSVSADGLLLHMCTLLGRDVSSFIMGRSPRLDEAALAAARSPPFSSVYAVRPDLQTCNVQTTAPAPAAGANAAAPIKAKSKGRRAKQQPQIAMGMAALHLCVLALLALCGGALARPTGEGAQANSAAAPDTFPANCGHTPRGNATPEQVQGVWYLLEGIYPPGDEERVKKLGTPTCILCNFTFENTSLSLFTTLGDGEETWTMNLAPSGMWAVQEMNGTVFLSISPDGQLLHMCTLSGGDVRSFIMGRRPRLDEASVAAARSPPFSSAEAMRPDLQSCNVLTTEAAPAEGADTAALPS